MKLSKRLDRLEAATGPEREALKIVFADPDVSGAYWDNSSFSDDRGERYSEDDLTRMRGEVQELLVISISKDWRGDSKTAA